MRRNNRIAAGINSNNTPGNARIPILTSLNNALRALGLPPAPTHNVVGFQPEIPLYPRRAKLCCVEIGQIFP